MNKPPKGKNFKLISIDIDDTMIPANTFAVSGRFRHAVGVLEKKGVRVCINTGRNAAYTIPVAREAGITSLCVSLEGLSVFEPLSGNIIFQNLLEVERLEKIIRIADKAGVFIETTDNDKYYRFLNESPKFSYNAGQDTHGLSEYVNSAEELLRKSMGAMCVTLGGEKASLSEAAAGIRKECGDVLFRNYLWQNYSVISRVIGPMHGKTYGLDWLCSHYKLDFSQCIAIGDYINDAGMIGRAGLGVSMGNGHMLIKALAGYVTDTVQNDGAAKVLEKVYKIKYRSK
jgi:hypothetical protein